MKPVTTRSHVLLQITLALFVATYIGLTSELVILSCIFYGASIVFSYLTVLSRAERRERKGKLTILTIISVISIILFLLVDVL
jgi:hypothetical protein